MDPEIIGAPDRIRTCDLYLRSALLTRSKKSSDFDFQSEFRNSFLAKNLIAAVDRWVPITCSCFIWNVKFRQTHKSRKSDSVEQSNRLSQHYVLTPGAKFADLLTALFPLASQAELLTAKRSRRRLIYWISLLPR